MKTGKSQTWGFTLVEIMIVVAMIGMLAAIAVPSFVQSRENSRQKACVNNLRQVDSAKDQFGLEYGLATGATIPNGINDLMVYLVRNQPTCPVGNTPYTINVIGQPPECAAPIMAAAHNAAYQ